jgi:hypothetical protein
MNCLCNYVVETGLRPVSTSFQISTELSNSIKRLFFGKCNYLIDYLLVI